MSEAFPWARLMNVGLGELRLSPSEFWNATLRELSVAVRTPGEPASRETLEELMKRFPDQ
jgi:uncharacterized phage protein (TIGR02216 family)